MCLPFYTNTNSYENDKLKTMGHNGFNYTFNYDKAGNTKEVKVGDKTLITNDYDFKTGLIKSSIYGNSNSTQFGYDENYRLKSKSFNNEIIPSFTYQYNNSGEVSQKYDNVNKLGANYNYDSIGRLSRVDDTNNNSIVYSYDNNNKLSNIEEKLFNKTYNTSYIYDKDNKYLGIKYKADSINYSQNIKYDELSRVRETSYNNSNGKKYTTSYNYGSYGGGVQYSTKAKNEVWNLGVEDGSLSGTTGESTQLEAIKLNLKDIPAGTKIKYETHSQNKGWTGVKYDGEVSGVEGQNLRIEAMKIELEGAPKGYGVKYRVHVSERGWLPWQSNGEIAGTTGLSLGIEAIEVQIVKPSINLSYSAKIKNGTWQLAVKDDELAGTTGKSTHIEALKINVEGLPVGAKVKYETYSQDKVWSGPRYDGQVAGVENKNFMMEAVKISLESAPKGYEIKYRVHVSNIGWLDWKKNGDVAGSITDGLGIEGIEIQLIRPGEGLTSINNNGEIINYTYDTNENIETIINGGKSIKYTYNEINEVVREDNQLLNKTIVYKYDVGGNIVSKKEYGYTIGALGTEISTINYGYGDANWKDKLTSYNGKAITYDQIGNPLTYDGNSYTWQNGRQLAGISGNGKTVSYKYNDAGIRTEKTVNGVTTKYTLNGDKVIYEDNGTDKIHYTYGGTGLVSLNLNGVEYYYVRNAQNDIIGLIDTDGQMVVKYNYDTWGKLLTIEGSLKDSLGVKNPYRYRGYKYDTDTGLYYLNSRYYNAEWGRFINADSVGGKVGTLLSHNAFAYCMNNPVNMSDPSGYWPKWLKSAASAVVNTVKKAVAAVVNTVKPAVSSINNIVKRNSLPTEGDPGSNKTLPNPDGTPKQKRWYGPDRMPERDRDYNHPGNMPFPHDHEWKNGERQREHLPPDPSYKFSLEPVIGIGLVTVGVIGIIAVAADDVTGIGVADNFLFGPLGAGVGKGMIMIFG